MSSPSPSFPCLPTPSPTSVLVPPTHSRGAPHTTARLLVAYSLSYLLHIFPVAFPCLSPFSTSPLTPTSDPFCPPLHSLVFHQPLIPPTNHQLFASLQFHPSNPANRTASTINPQPHVNQAFRMSQPSHPASPHHRTQPHIATRPNLCVKQRLVRGRARDEKPPWETDEMHNASRGKSERMHTNIRPVIPERAYLHTRGKG